MCHHSRDRQEVPRSRRALFGELRACAWRPGAGSESSRRIQGPKSRRSRRAGPCSCAGREKTERGERYYSDRQMRDERERDHCSLCTRASPTGRTHTLPHPPPVTNCSAGSYGGPPSAPEVYGTCVGEHAQGRLRWQPGLARRCFLSHCRVYRPLWRKLLLAFTFLSLRSQHSPNV